MSRPEKPDKVARGAGGKNDERGNIALKEVKPGEVHGRGGANTDVRNVT